MKFCCYSTTSIPIIIQLNIRQQILYLPQTVHPPPVSRLHFSIAMLCSIPAELLFQIALFLKFNGLLQLRLVSRQLNHLLDDYFLEKWVEKNSSNIATHYKEYDQMRKAYASPSLPRLIKLRNELTIANKTPCPTNIAYASKFIFQQLSRKYLIKKPFICIITLYLETHQKRFFKRILQNRFICKSSPKKKKFHLLRELEIILEIYIELNSLHNEHSYEYLPCEMMPFIDLKYIFDRNNALQWLKTS